MNKQTEFWRSRASRAARRIAAGCIGLALLAVAAGAQAAPSTQPVTIPAEAPPAVSRATFPLRSAPSGRHLVDAAGHPFLIHGDAAWSLMAQLKRPQVDEYLETRRRQGFNAVLVELLEHKFSDHPPLNAYGDPPLLRPGDFSTPNEAYFAHADYVIGRAADKGMVVLLAAAYMGYGGGDEGWYRELTANSPGKLRAYGQYVARRLGSHQNIVWIHGGDFMPPEKTALEAVVAGIRDVQGPGLHSLHASRGHSALGALGPGAPWLSVNNIYTDEHSVVAHARREYARSTLPFFLIEARYENEKGAGAAVLRRQAYQALLSGACGQIMGNNPVWKFGAGWEAALRSDGATSMQQLRSFLDSIAWWNLVPDSGNQFLVAGAGSGAEAVAAVDAAGQFAAVYLPTVRAVTLDLRKLRGPRVEARWYDPVNGRFHVAGGSPFASGGMKVLSPDGGSSGGADDWLLLLQSVR